MAQKIKKGLFRILPWSMVVLMVFTLSIGGWQNSTFEVNASVATDWTIIDPGSQTVGPNYTNVFVMGINLPVNNGGVNSITDSIVAGSGTAGTVGTSTFPAGWALYGYDNVGAGLYNNAADWIGTDNDGDSKYTSQADTAADCDGSAGTGPGNGGGCSVLGAGAAITTLAGTENLCTDSLTAPTVIYIDGNGDCTSGNGGVDTTLRDDAGGIGSATVFVGTNWAFVDDLVVNVAWDDGEDLIYNGAGANGTPNTSWSAGADTLIGGVVVTHDVALVDMNAAKPAGWTDLLIIDGGAVGTWEGGPNDLIFTDDDGSTYYNGDKLTSIQIGSPGTCNEASINKIIIWEDGASSGWDGDETNIGSLTQSGVGTLIGQTINTPGASVYTSGSDYQRLMVTIDLTATPTDTCTFQPRILTNGAVLASTNDGPTDTFAGTAGIVTVDSQAPTGTVVLGTATLFDGDLVQEVTVNYDEPMDGASTPTITFGGTVGVFTSNVDGTWATATQWTETFTITDVGETVVGATADSSLATDVAGNVEGADVQGTFNVDTANPTGTVLLGTVTLFDGDLVQEVTVNYDEPMDGASTPTITFGGTVGVFTSNVDGTWATATQWTETFTITDVGETVVGATADSSLATDVAGNVEGADVQGTFNVDTANPTGTVLLGTVTLFDGDLVQEVTVNYDEPMAPGSTPTITFGGTAGVFTSNVDGTWATATQWTETFTITDAGETVVGATADSSLATDVAGNVEGADVQGTFNVDTANPTGTVLLGTVTLFDGDLVQEVTVNYDEPMAPGSTPTITFGGTAGVFTSNVDGTWATATQWTETFTITDAGETVVGATADSSLATDVAGNVEGADVQGTFNVDTANPTGTVVLGTATLFDGDLVQEVTVNYDEPMDGASTPTITFGGTAGVFTSNVDGTWATATQWTETFTITDAGETVVGATADSSLATDVAGNVEGADVQGTFNVDTANPTGTVVLGTATLFDGDLVQEVTVNYDEPRWRQGQRRQLPSEVQLASLLPMQMVLGQQLLNGQKHLQ